jgi:hypothetical protein
MKLSDKEVIAEMQSQSFLNQVRTKFVSGYVKIEQEVIQCDITPIEMRRREFTLAEEIIKMVTEEVSRRSVVG